MSAEAPRGRPELPRRWLPIGAVVVVVVGAAAMLAGRQLVAPAPTPSQPAASGDGDADADADAGAVQGSLDPGGDAVQGGSAAAPDAAAEPEGFTRFNDPVAGLSIAYPSDWRRSGSANPDIKLLASHEGASLLVRTTDIGVEVGADSLAAARPLTDKLVKQARQVRLSRAPAQVSLGGLPGYLYLYSFRDLTTGVRGKHAHYFLFRGQTMITIVFQTVPAVRFPSFAQTFDQIGETLRTGAAI